MKQKQAVPQFDLSEEASRRSTEAATAEARQQKRDDSRENTAAGPVSKPAGDNWAENRVTTSLNEDE